MSASAAAVALQLGSSRRARAVAVWFSLDQHGPEDTRGLGGERDHHDLVGSAREQIPQPRIADPARSLMPQIGACAADQQRPQHAVMYGRPPLGKSFLVFRQADPGAAMSTRSRSGLSPRGRMGIPDRIP